MNLSCFVEISTLNIFWTRNLLKFEIITKWLQRESCSIYMLWCQATRRWSHILIKKINPSRVDWGWGGGGGWAHKLLLNQHIVIDFPLILISSVWWRRRQVFCESLSPQTVDTRSQPKRWYTKWLAGAYAPDRTASHLHQPEWRCASSLLLLMCICGRRFSTTKTAFTISEQQLQFP